MKKVADFLAVLLATFFEEVMKNNTKKMAKKIQDEWARIKPKLKKATPIFSVILIVIGIPLLFGSSPPFPNLEENSDEDGISCEEKCMNKCNFQNERLEECSSLTVNTITETTTTTITTITTIVVTTENTIVTTTIITTITIITTSTHHTQCSTTQHTITTEKR